MKFKFRMCGNFYKLTGYENNWKCEKLISKIQYQLSKINTINYYKQDIIDEFKSFNQILELDEQTYMKLINDFKIKHKCSFDHAWKYIKQNYKILFFRKWM